MKKYLLIIFLSLFIYANFSLIFAQSPTTSPKPTDESSSKQVKDLMDRLATKAADLRNLQRKAIEGKVKAQTISSMTIETKTKDIKIELIDNIKVAQYLKGKRTKLTIDDVDNGDYVYIFGDYDSTIDTLRAKIIIIDNSPPLVKISGIIKSRDEEEFTITLEATDQIQYIIDVEKTTNVSEWSDSNISKSGFSKLKVGDTVQISGTAVPKKEKRFTAVRLIDLGQLLPAKEPSPTTAQSPIVSQTPNSTGKSTPTPTVE